MSRRLCFDSQVPPVVSLCNAIRTGRLLPQYARTTKIHNEINVICKAGSGIALKKTILWEDSHNRYGVLRNNFLILSRSSWHFYLAIEMWNVENTERFV